MSPPGRRGAHRRRDDRHEPAVGPGRILGRQKRALDSSGCARAELTAMSTGIGPVVDRTLLFTDIHEGFQLVIDCTRTGDVPPECPAPVPRQLDAEELDRAENAAAEALNSTRTDIRRCVAALSGTAVKLPPGEGADQQCAAEDGGRLRPDTTAWSAQEAQPASSARRRTR